ncbi:MAG: alanine dehydrogenase [Candidatus Bathyarchaeia archaeon]
MIIGVPREIKDNEYRVGLTPGGASALVEVGSRVLVQKGAGGGSGFSDREYAESGAEVVSAEEAWGADLVVKVKEPQPTEYPFLREDMTIFTYLHLANPGLGELTKTLVAREVTGIAYETVVLPNGEMPLLEPMSEIAGKMAVQIAAKYLERPNGGMGKLLGGAIGVEAATVVIIGAGTVGTNAALVALGAGADVIVLNRSVWRLRQLARRVGLAHPGNLTTLALNPVNLKWALRVADVVIGAVYARGARSPKIVSRELLSLMKPGSVVVDVDIDQGGIFETSRPTSHSDPAFVADGVIHYCVANMPGAVPMTSTRALTNATLPYVLKLARQGFIQAVRGDSSLAAGVNTYKSHITEKGVAEAHDLPYKPLAEVIGAL